MGGGKKIASSRKRIYRANLQEVHILNLNMVDAIVYSFINNLKASRKTWSLTVREELG